MKLLLTIPLSSDDAPELEQLLTRLGTLEGSCVLELADAPPRLLVQVSQDWRLQHQEALLTLQSELGTRAGTWSWQTQQDLDWGSSFSAALRPLHFGALTILPVPSAPASMGETALILDAQEAFGTGLHPTTALILRRMEELAPLEGPLLDVGTGSGILALAGLRLGCSVACGVDPEEAALRSARANARRNGLEHLLQLYPTIPRGTALYPLVVANILPAVLMALADALVRQLCPRGILLLSGLQRNDREQVLSTYRRLGCHLLMEEEEGGWLRLELLAPY